MTQPLCPVQLGRDPRTHRVRLGVPMQGYHTLTDAPAPWQEGLPARESVPSLFHNKVFAFSRGARRERDGGYGGKYPIGMSASVADQLMTQYVCQKKSAQHMLVESECSSRFSNTDGAF